MKSLVITLVFLAFAFTTSAQVKQTETVVSVTQCNLIGYSVYYRTDASGIYTMEFVFQKDFTAEQAEMIRKTVRKKWLPTRVLLGGPNALILQSTLKKVQVEGRKVTYYSLDFDYTRVAKRIAKVINPEGVAAAILIKNGVAPEDEKPIPTSTTRVRIVPGVPINEL